MRRSKSMSDLMYFWLGVIAGALGALLIHFI